MKKRVIIIFFSDACGFLLLLGFCIFSLSQAQGTPKTTPNQIESSFSYTMMILFLLVMSVRGRRGRARAKTKSRIINGLPITGKFRDPESDQYYNNNNVMQGAKIILSSHFDYEYVLGHKIAFLCVARGNPRPQITWFKDGIELYAHYLSHVHEWKMGADKVKSKLEIDPATQMDAGIYECSANNMYSIDSRSFKTDFSIAFD